MSEKFAIGIPWYSADNYGAIRKIMADGHSLPGSYREWLEKAEGLERHAQAMGAVAVRAAIDPSSFPAWCRERCLNVDGKARIRFADDAASVHGL